MPENQTPESPAVDQTPEPSRKRKIIAVATTTALTVALTIVSNVAIEVATDRVKKLIIKPDQTKI